VVTPRVCHHLAGPAPRASDDAIRDHALLAAPLRLVPFPSCFWIVRVNTVNVCVSCRDVWKPVLDVPGCCQHVPTATGGVAR
jgi:hypothetical protein